MSTITLPEDLTEVLKDLMTYSFGPVEFESLTRKEKEIFGSPETFQRLLGALGLTPEYENPVAGGQCPQCGAPHHGTSDQKCDHL